MSMLAERKRKQKWSLNPRGKHWSEDSNKFGQKLLEKMGWSAGKGLGAKEDGITEHIRVFHKNDSKGMGYKESDDQWTQHESNFSQLLNSLSNANGKENTGNENEIKLESLEKKSQKSRARVHYHKFTRGKDLSRYSERDLANIFGKKSLKKENSVKNEEPIQETIDETFEAKSFGVETHNRGSMLEYFKKKMSNYKKYDVNSEIKSAGVKSDSEEERPSFGFGFNVESENKMKTSFVSYIKENTSDNENGNAKSKKCEKNINLEAIQEGTEDNEYVSKTELSSNCNLKSKSENELVLAFTPLKKKFKNFESLNSLQDEEKIEKTPTKKCKRKKFRKEYRDDNSNEDEKNDFKTNGLTNPAFDSICNRIAVEKHLLDVIEEENEDNHDESFKKNSLEYKEEVEQAYLKKKKKNKKTQNFQHENTDSKTVSNGLENPAFESPCSETPIGKSPSEIIKNKDNFQDEILLKKNICKKKKKSKHKEGIENSCFEDFAESSFLSIEEHSHVDEATSMSIDEPKKKNKKSKKGKKLTQSVIENVDLNFIESTVISKKSEDFELKKILKKKKSESEGHLSSLNIFSEERSKSKKKKYENCENPKETIREINEDLQDFQQKASKTKKRKKDQGIAIDNPCFNPNDSTACLETTNTIYEVKRKTKDTNLGCDNAGLDLSSPSPKKQKIKEVRAPLQLEMPVMDEEIMLNVVDTPILKKKEENTLSQRRKSVRFSKVNQRIFMNNADSPADLRKNGYQGVDNEAYDELGNRIDENINTLSKELDDYQAKVENDMNEAKIEVMVGEMGDPNGENQILPDGDVKLKYKYAHFGRTPPWLKKNGDGNAKTSYRHLIKGDIVLGFKNTNLHEIKGYGKVRQGDIC